MGSSDRATPGTTLLKADYKFLTYNNLVQVITITVKYYQLINILIKQKSHPSDSLRYIDSLESIIIMKIGLILICSLALLSSVQSVEVSLDNLKGFFWATYDRDDDGAATVQ